MARIMLIKYNPDGTELYRYILGNFKRFSYDINSPVTPAPLPEEDSSENVLVKIQGNSSNMTIGWKIKNEASNREVRAGIDTKTISEQVRFFDNNFASTSIEDSFALVIDFNPPANVLDVSTDLLEWRGTFTKLHFDTIDGENLTFNVSTNFLQGNVVTIYEIDVPSQPPNFVVTSPSSGRIDASWDLPLDEGSNVVTDYRVQYRLGSNNWTDVDFVKTGASESVTVATGLTSGLYDIRVKAKSSLGFGVPTITKVINVT